MRKLLVERVDSFEKLELLQLTCRARTLWTVAAASSHLRISEALADVGFQELENAGLLVREAGGFRYEPRSRALAASADALCQLYQDDRLLIVNILTTSALDRIRSSAATTFADAFRFRKKDPEGGSDG